MEFIFEFILQMLGEIAFQAVAEMLFELGAHSLADTVRRPKHPILSTIGFLIWGTVAGAISLFILPASLISDPKLRAANVIVTPLAVGGIMMLVGRRRARRGDPLVRIDRFGYAFVFALAMAVVRYFWAG